METRSVTRTASKNERQFSKFKKPIDNGPKPPKVKSGGSYKYPKPVPTREERDLMESKARINNAKAAKLNREA